MSRQSVPLVSLRSRQTAASTTAPLTRNAAPKIGTVLRVFSASILTPSQACWRDGEQHRGEVPPDLALVDEIGRARADPRAERAPEMVNLEDVRTDCDRGGHTQFNRQHGPSSSCFV
ncbi:hypothetical protein ACFQEQ_02565 [Halolamina salina]|uniref:Uncharacterized protein n=1 Tax=Halolamina salina TaxID=1220023 RepID=A0ABD6B7Z2_9EURY